MLLVAHQGFAGVSRAIQEKYRRAYENKALFLKVPVFAEKQYVELKGGTISPDQGPNTGVARFKVGDQVRVLGLDFGGDEIRFKLGAISGAGLAEIIFKFDSPLQETFPNSDFFEKAVQATFTEGLKYSDLEDAKRGYVEDQFERVVREIAATSGASREAVLKNMAPHLPAYQDAMRDIENLRNRNQNLNEQVSQMQSENRKLEADLKAQLSEAARLRSANQGLQEKIDSSAMQLSRLGDDLRSARGATQGYQRELASLQRSLNIKVDASRDLASQIGDLGQAMRKLQKDNEGLLGQNSSLRTNMEKLQSQIAKLQGDLEDAKNSNREMKDTIAALTSKEDSLARQYLDLKREKENLDTAILSMDNLSTRTVEESVTDGFHSGKAQVYLKNVLIGFLEWRLPERLSHAEQQQGEVGFSSESIDYVRVTPEERVLLRSLGDRLKLQVKLAPTTPTIDVKPENDKAVQEIGERERATWRWSISNNGTQDSRLVLGVRFINRNADSIPVFLREQAVTSSSIVRQVRNYLQPIPVAIGALFGFLLFGIVGIFRHAAHREKPHDRQLPPENTPPYVGHKKL